MSYLLYFLLIILSVADYWTTFIILSRGGVEKNPLVNFFIKRWGIKLGILAIKAIPLLAMGVLIYLYPSVTIDFLIFLVTIYCWAVWHNFREIK